MKKYKHKDLVVLAFSLLLVFSSLVFLKEGGITGATTMSVRECGLLDSAGTYLLIQNVTSPGTCFEIGASNVVLDCQGYSITYGRGYAVNNNGFSDVEVKNCLMKAGNSSGENQ